MRRKHEIKVIIVANGELGVICGVCVCVWGGGGGGEKAGFQSH